jgi:hypothetical protein
VLVDNSLVHQVVGTRAERRFGMLEMIREFAQQELQASGDEAAIREAYAHYVSALAGESFRRLRRTRVSSPPSVRWQRE